MLSIPITVDTNERYIFKCMCKNEISDSRLELRSEGSSQVLQYITIPTTSDFREYLFEFTPITENHIILFRTANNNNSMYVDNCSLNIQ